MGQGLNEGGGFTLPHFGCSTPLSPTGNYLANQTCWRPKQDALPPNSQTEGWKKLPLKTPTTTAKHDKTKQAQTYIHKKTNT